MSTAVAPKGLEGIVATTSSICYIDGEAGVLSYRGIDIHELAKSSTFEETTYLLWFGTLPTSTQLAAFHSQLAAARTLPAKVTDLLHSVPPDATPMQVLRTAVSLLSIYDADEAASSHDANVRKVLSPHRADRDDRRHLRPHPQGQARRRSRQEPLPRRQLPLHAQWREALRHRHPAPSTSP